jgi:hypothetical protein
MSAEIEDKEVPKTSVLSKIVPTFKKLKSKIFSIGSSTLEKFLKPGFSWVSGISWNLFTSLAIISTCAIIGAENEKIALCNLVAAAYGIQKPQTMQNPYESKK